MIIDMILDRKCGFEYTEEDLKYAYDMSMECNLLDLARAIDSGTNNDIQNELCNYIKGNNYNVEICEYVNSVDWLKY